MCVCVERIMCVCCLSVVCVAWRTEIHSFVYLEKC